MTVDFRQLIGGIPVDFTSHLDAGPNGTVKLLIAQVFDPSGVPSQLISRDEALRIATELIERELGHLGVVKITWMSNVDLVHVAKSMSQEERAVELTPTWRVPAQVTTLTGSLMDGLMVVINAATGKADIRRSLLLR